MTTATAVKDGEVLEHTADAASETTAIARREHEQQIATMSDAIAIVRRPRDVINSAIEAAQALMQAIGNKPKKVVMNGEQYIEVEDWTLVAAFHGCTLQLESDEYITYGDASGWEATVALIARDGRVVGRATMMCMDDEEKWSDRPKYEWCQLLKQTQANVEKYGAVEHDGKWYAKPREAPADAVEWEEAGGKRRPKAERLQTGVDKVPQFQLRSMAQTRAAGKVCRLNLAYIPMLAGLRTTPAEELADVERVDNRVDNGQQTSQNVASTTQAAAQTTNGKAAGQAAGTKAQTAQAANGALYQGYPVDRADDARITAGDNAAFWNYAASQNASAPELAKWVKARFNVKSGSEMTVGQLKEAVRYVRGELVTTTADELEPGSDG